MNLFNFFRKKRTPAFDPGLYDWKFEFVKGGFCHLSKLNKPKKVIALMWIGGLRFKCFSITVDTVDSFKSKSGRPLHSPSVISFVSEDINKQQL